VQSIQALAARHPHRLLERFAEAVADIVLNDFRAAWVRVRVAKLGALPGVREIGVAIERRAAGPG
jgi:dihydroneopterin aldolase